MLLVSINLSQLKLSDERVCNLVQKQNLTGQSLRCMKPSSKATLESMESAFFQGVSPSH